MDENLPMKLHIRPVCECRCSMANYGWMVRIRKHLIVGAWKQFIQGLIRTCHTLTTLIAFLTAFPNVPLKK